MEYIIKYSNRKTIGIYVNNDGTVEVRSPKFVTKTRIEELVRLKESWIENTKKRILQRKHNEIGEDEVKRLVKLAKEVIPTKVKKFSEIMNVEPLSVRIGNSKSYWGCCSSKNRLNFSWRLMQASDNAIDYVVIHELAHIKEHNHSKEFWDEVAMVMPDYKKYREELKNF